MQRYFFNVYNDVDVIDDEGLELPDLSAAKDEAIRGARGMMADHILAGRPVSLSHRIEVADADGKVMASMPFRELITIKD